MARAQEVVENIWEDETTKYGDSEERSKTTGDGTAEWNGEVGEGEGVLR